MATKLKHSPLDRRTIRLTGYDYSQPGAYFITICARERESLLGQVTDSRMICNEFGKIVSDCWAEMTNRYTEAIPDAFVVMPNHVHGVIIVGAIHELPLQRTPMQTGPFNRQQRRNMLIPKIVGWFKMNTAKQINQARGTAGNPVWQRNYWEHVVRNEESLDLIREYITTNPARWHLDAENPLRDGMDDFDRWLTDPVGASPVGAIHELPLVNRPPSNPVNAMFNLNTPEETLKYFLFKVMSEEDATRFMSLKEALSACEAQEPKWQAVYALSVHLNVLGISWARPEFKDYVNKRMIELESCTELRRELAGLLPTSLEDAVAKAEEALAAKAENLAMIYLEWAGLMLKGDLYHDKERIWRFRIPLCRVGSPYKMYRNSVAAAPTTKATSS